MYFQMKNERGASTLTIVLILLVLLGCCCVATAGTIGGILLLSEDEKITDDDNGHTTDDNDDDNDDQDNNKKDDNDTPTPPPQDDRIRYYDMGWDITLYLPEGWADYEVIETSGSASDYYMHSVEFLLPSSNGDLVSFFVISVYTPDQWDNVLYGEDVLARKNGYIYSWSQLNGMPPSDLEDNLQDLEDIKDSVEVGEYPTAE